MPTYSRADFDGIGAAIGKDGATVYTLVASDPEVARLKKEEKDLEGVANVSWAKA